MKTRPVYRSLSKTLTIMGVERRLFFGILLTCLAIFQMFEAVIAALLLFVLLWIFARAATQADPQLIRILLSSNRFAVRYDPALWEEGSGRNG
jgi:type IV secretory pathway TrbD component